MRLSTRGRYSVRAMLHIALQGKNGPVSLKRLSDRQDISTDYLEQLLRKLRKARLVRSVRGPKGGFLLARKESDIRVWDVVAAVEPELAPVHCVDSAIGRRSRQSRCSRVKNCAAHRMWGELARVIHGFLVERTLKDLADDARSDGSRSASEKQLMLHI